MIPGRFETSTLENYEPVTDSQRAALAAVNAWLAEIRGGGAPMLALVGDSGTGKSHLLWSAAKDLGLRCFARSWYEFVDHLRYGVSVAIESGTRERSPGEVRAHWWESKVVLLDEVRPTSGTAFDDTELARFACHAYDHLVPVLVTTNVNPLADVMGPAAASRFTEVVVTGPDARKAAA